ncbi:hypothetical protein [Phytoactinopolyspora endophytica]|uniref:hypothetical protein n=1 Tax=Phytoactinopolyspora endophytica TaxID=1642495 RepID=UPI00101C007E|nr:hypothetical protein [Phytoactinopolyspora endophytica]
MTTQVPYRPVPVDQSDVRYAHGPDSVVQSGVPAGETIEFDWRDSTTYPGTSRRFWVHVPAMYDPSEPAALMVFQDGQWYLDPEGEVRGGIVLDNLIHGGDIPVVIGVFVDPGVFEDVADAHDRKNRNVEYDAAALAEAGYDFRLVLGDGGHSPNHGGVLLPDALRWLWR